MIPFVQDQIEIVRGTKKDYLELAEYHYIKTKVLLPTDVWIARPKGRFQNNFPPVIGVHVWSTPMPGHQARDRATGCFFKVPATRKARLELLNRNMRFGARLIVLPSFRKLGIGSKLLSAPLLTTRIPLLETFTPIDFTNDMLVKAGFRRYDNPAPVFYLRFENSLLRLGLTKQSFACPDIVHRRLESLSGYEKAYYDNEILFFLRHFRGWSSKPRSFARTKFFLHKIGYPQAYFLWRNPRVGLSS